MITKPNTLQQQKSMLLALSIMSLFMMLHPPLLLANFKIIKADNIIRDNLYQLTAKIDYSLNPVVEDALHNGVPLVIKLRVEIVLKRQYLWPKKIYYQTQVYRLRYHALTRRYLIKNQNSGRQHNYRDLNTALSDLGNLQHLPLLPQKLINPSETYIARLQVKLHIRSLPPLLQPRAYLSSAWHLESPWFKWQLHP